MRRILPLTDCQIKNGCYQPAHCETIEWRTGWTKGFVKEWKKQGIDCCVDEHFKCRQEDGWKRGEEAGKRDRDPNNKWPRYPYPQGGGKKVEKNIDPFRMAWRIGWYKGYYCSYADDVDTLGRKLGSGSRYGGAAAKRYCRLNCAATNNA